MPEITVRMGDLRRIVVAIDPAVTNNEDSDETGIIIVGRGPHQPDTCMLEDRCKGHGYILEDLSGKYSPHEWARAAIRAYDHWSADRVVAEVNNGGDMVGETIHAIRTTVPYTAVRATRGKLTRAEPVAALYEQGRVHHLGSFVKLEDQLTTWTPDHSSPDRLDALVWGITALGLIGGQGDAFLSHWRAETAAPRDRIGKAEVIQLQRLMGKKRRVKAGVGARCEHRWHPASGLCVFCGSDRPSV